MKRTPLLLRTPRTATVGNIVSEMSENILIVFQDRKNTFWFGSDGQGCYRYDGKALVHFSEKDGLPGGRVREIQEDKNGNIFLTTLDGICKFDGQKFTTLKPIRIHSAKEGWRLHPDDLWFKGDSMENGPYRYDGKALYHLKFPRHYLEEEHYKKNPTGVGNPYGVYTIYRDKRGALWFGTAALGVGRYDGTSFRWMYEDHLTNPPSGGSFGIRSIIEDKRERFWFCNTEFRYKIYPSGSREKRNDLIAYQREDGIGGVSGSESSKSLYYLSIIEDNKRDLWMATYRDGVWRYDGKKMTHYSVKDGSKDTTVFSIYKDNRGDLWLGTHASGVYRFNGRAFEKFRNGNAADVPALARRWQRG
jgi:ligand-binding sensor domain-containing protein